MGYNTAAGWGKDLGWRRGGGVEVLMVRGGKGGLGGGGGSKEHTMACTCCRLEVREGERLCEREREEGGGGGERERERERDGRKSL